MSFLFNKRTAGDEPDITAVHDREDADQRQEKPCRVGKHPVAIEQANRSRHHQASEPENNHAKPRCLWRPPAVDRWRNAIDAERVSKPSDVEHDKAGQAKHAPRERRRIPGANWGH